MSSLMNTSSTTNKTAIASAIVIALGGGTAAHGGLPAPILTFEWSGVFTMVDSGGGLLANTSITTKGANQFQTPVTGTMVFDVSAGSGSATMVPFDFFAGSLPAEAVGINMQAIGDGAGGQGSLILGNMLFNWNGNYGIPVSIVMDGAGLFQAIGPSGTGVAVNQSVGLEGGTATLKCVTDITCTAPASDGTYTNAAFGYLDIGPAPIATLDWNTTNTAACIADDPGTTPADESDCLNVSPSGELPLLRDTVANGNRYDVSTPTIGDFLDATAIGGGPGQGLGGNPMQDGPFGGFNANFDITNLLLVSDGSGSITAPASVSDTIPETPPLPATSPIDLGTPTNVVPLGTAEYCIDGIATCSTGGIWLDGDDATANIIDVPITQTVNVVPVSWRAGGGTAFDNTQTATVTVNDLTPPTITSTPAPVTVTWPNTAIPIDVCFGAATAQDAVEPNVVVEYSINNQSNWQVADPTDNCSTNFLLNDNTVYWRAKDAAVPTPNISPVTTQTVTLNLPAGITGTECVIDLATAGARLVDSRFTMRDSAGSPTGDIDNTVTGDIDTTKICDDVTCGNVIGSAASLITTQPFFQLLWKATPIRLFGEGTWTIEACPLPRIEVNPGTPGADWISDPNNGGDGSTKCGDQFAPNPIELIVGPGQLGAHMLFEWGTSKSIDVVNAWDVDCSQFELTASDPDGDGILGTPMVDGPFKGFNAAFDLNTQAGEDPIAEGGFNTTTQVVKNPVAGANPLPLTVDTTPPANADPDALRSCVGGCNDFTTTVLQDGGAYKYAQVVLPLTEATPFWSLYRKYDKNTGTWKRFEIDGRNDVKTAPYVAGTIDDCPQPGDGSYDRPSNGLLADKLRAGDPCVQLTIEDNGPNDSNPAVGTVADPGGVAEVPAPPLPAPEDLGGDGGCSVSATPVDPASGGAWWLLTGLLGWMGWKRRRT